MAPVQKLKYTDRLAFTFQKQVYVYEKPQDGADNGHVTLATPAQRTGLSSAPLESWKQMRSCRQASQWTDLFVCAVAEHLRSTGLNNEDVIRTSTELFGKNSLLVRLVLSRRDLLWKRKK